MDAGDVWLPHALATLLAWLEAHPEAIGSHGLADMIDPGGGCGPDGGALRDGA
jgi:hypothetical protein